MEVRQIILGHSNGTRKSEKFNQYSWIAVIKGEPYKRRPVRATGAFYSEADDRNSRMAVD